MLFYNLYVGLFQTGNFMYLMHFVIKWKFVVYIWSRMHVYFHQNNVYHGKLFISK